MVDRDPNSGVQRRVAGYHDVRMDGIHDLVLRARGMSVLDVGCNRGMVGFELACNGARLIHGIDNDSDAIRTAREVFADIRNVQAKFWVMDLRQGAVEVEKQLGAGNYDLILLLAIVHKLCRVMELDKLKTLLHYFGRKAHHYVGAHMLDTPVTEPDGQTFNHFEITDECLKAEGLDCIHRSYISEIGPGFIWKRVRPVV